MGFKLNWKIFTAARKVLSLERRAKTCYSSPFFRANLIYNLISSFLSSSPSSHTTKCPTKQNSNIKRKKVKKLQERERRKTHTV